MKVGIVGLGLMGASFAQALHKKQMAEVLGTDLSQEVLDKALSTRTVDGVLTPQGASALDMLVVCVYPRNFREATLPYLPFLKEGALVTDFCGIKKQVLEDMQQLSEEYPLLHFVGGHPIAGREYSGIDFATPDLFEKQSVVLVPLRENCPKLDFLKQFYLSLGFGTVEVCNAEQHDVVIAYTSQLCHVVSNAFIKNKHATLHDGYSAGSYKDLTRVAKMNSRMWAELMTDNRHYLAEELDELISHLEEYLKALQAGDEALLQQLLEEGNLRKIQIDSEKEE